jgi:SAM-dependent methyltransferase
VSAVASTLKRALRGEASRRLFSETWHGINLEDVARETGLAADAIASHHFYEALYRRWKTNRFASDPGWVEGKRQIADLMIGTLTSFAVPGPVLSLGAGLGLIEEHLLDAGWEIELQECQGESLSRFSETGRARVWVTAGLAGLSGTTYGAILAISMAYALDNTQYGAVLRDCHRLLKPGGVLVVWDHDIRVSLAPLRRLLRGGPRPLLWGWLRSPALHQAIGVEAGFRHVRTRFFDHRLQAIDPPFRITGVQGPFGSSLAQELLFRKEG